MERNVPKLRFKGFNDEWKNTKLGDISNIIMGQSPSSDQYNEKFEGMPLVQGNADIRQRKTSPRMYTTEVTKACKIGDSIMSVRAPVGSIGRATEKCCIGRGVCAINTCEKQEFLYQVLLQQEDKWGKVSQGSTFESINRNDIANLRIKLPSLQEQERIANFLTKVDKIIEKQDEKVKNLEKYKKGMMQKIFSQEIRFKDENGKEYPEWQEYKLNELCNFFSGGTPLTSKKEYYDGNIPFIRSAEISSENTELTISEIGLNNSSAKMIQKGDLLYALYGATSGEVSISKLNGAINQAILCIRSNRCNLIFLEKVLRNSKQNIIKTYLQGGQGNLSANIIKELQFNFPCLDEQDKIAKFITKIDIILQKEIDKLNELYKWKKGLLQQMFV